MTANTILPPRILPLPRNVRLRRSVDIQLDHAFQEEQWTVAATLARQRYKVTKDEYFKAVEIAAKSHSDNPVDRVTGSEAVQTMVEDNTIIRDVDTLDLYEFACDRLSVDYARTIGVLRARLVKALPRDQTSGIKCLEACVWNSDWENAQEIAVSLNKNFPAERKFLFQNILTTYLVSISNKTHENKKKLFPNLAKAQADKAFNLRLIYAGKDQDSLGQVSTCEGEVLLWLAIRKKYGSAQENRRLLTLHEWGPLVFLERGFISAFRQAIELLVEGKQWDEVLRVGYAIFEKAALASRKRHPKPETARDAAAQREDNLSQDANSTASHQLDNTVDSIPVSTSNDIIGKRYLEASHEWYIWWSMFSCAKHEADQARALKALRKSLEKVARILRGENMMQPVFEKNYNRIMLAITLFRASALGNGGLGSNTKVQHLLKFSHELLRDPDCFNVVKLFLLELSKEEIACLIDALASETEDHDTFEELLLVALRLRIVYFQATSLQAGEECRICQSVVKYRTDCMTCIKRIADNALRAFSLGIQSESVSQIQVNEKEDPLSHLAVLGSICLLKVAGIGYGKWRTKQESPIYHIDIQLFLQAVVWLDFYLRKRPKNDSLRLLLVKLYLMMGCATRAMEVWGPFDVKNTLLECLGSLCLDRLASISAIHFIPGSGRPGNAADPLIGHFESATREKYPKIAVVCLQNDSYQQLIGATEHVEKQNRSCVMALAVVEYRRGLRLKSGRSETAIQDEPLIGSLSSDCELEDFTDYSPLPHYGGPSSVPTQKLVNYGPLPTSRRCHMSILAERFIDMVCYVQPKDFKPSKAAQLQNADWQAATSVCNDLHERLYSFLIVHEDAKEDADLTGPERRYFELVAELTEFVKLVLEHLLAATSTRLVREEILAVVQVTLELITEQTNRFLALPGGISTKMHTLHGVAALHAMGMLRESSLAVKHTVQYVSAALDRFKATDKSRGANEAAWLSPELKKLSAAAALADTQMKNRVKKLSENVNTSGWVDRLEEWAFKEGAVYQEPEKEFKHTITTNLSQMIPQEFREAWAIDIADSWRDAVKGWSAVKFD
ncbi:hypothetical protein F5Y19DRAFT_465407 [Xylariaceae sp. FL1651]|nr:hypothetical protein F5Y19DRAFT_465407 [Xylariaceae sp. FL1651]